jgi:TP901 family phage tail tape measure protein
MSDGKVIFKYVGDTSGIDRSNAEAEGKLHKFASLAGNALLAIGTAAVAAGAAIVKIGSSFESAFAGVIKTVNATETELGDLRKGILDMSKELPASAAEIASVAEAAGQLGIKTPNILEFTKAMIDLGESTNMTADQAATELARFANIMQMPQTEFTKLGSAVVALGNNFATTEAEIVSMGMRLAGAGKQAGMTEADIMGFAAALSSVGIEAEAGGTAMSKVFTDINIAVQTGSEELANFAYVAGMKTDEFARMFKENAAGAVSAFIKGLGKAGNEAVVILEEMGISEIRMRDALLRASGAGDLLTQSITTSNEAWEENIALSNEASKRYETLESRFEMLKNQVSGIAISVYDKLRPALSDALDGFSEMFKKIEEDGSLDELSETLGGIAKILSNALSGILPLVLDLLNAVLKPVTKLVEQLLPPILDIVEALVPLLEIVFEILGPIIDLLGNGLSLALGLVADALSIVVGLLGMLIEGLKWLFTLGTQGGNFDKYINMLTKPFSSSGSLYNAASSIINEPMNQAATQYNRGTVGGYYAGLEERDEDLSDEEWYKKYFGNNARGTNFWKGGWTWVGEQGPELVNLPIGTRIYPSEVSERMVSPPNISNSNSTIIDKVIVYPEQEEYIRLIGLLESHETARQMARAGGYNG